MIVTTGGRRKLDLGRLDPDCPASYHGTYTAVRWVKCQCPHAVESNRIYKKRVRAHRVPPALLDACGVRRRIQALWAIGHTSQDISDATGGRFSRYMLVQMCRQAQVSRSTHAVIADVYRVLMVRPGGSRRAQLRAQAAGYPTPLDWGADIDNPAAVPEIEEPQPTDLGAVDEQVVERALSGERVDLTDAELVAALQIGTARGEALSAVSARLGINHVGAQRLVRGELTPQRAKRARIAEELRRDAARSNQAIAAELGVHHTTVAGVRRRIFADPKQAAS